jgi:hypothetical protein
VTIDGPGNVTPSVRTHRIAAWPAASRHALLIFDRCAQCRRWFIVSACAGGGNAIT